jgi:uncharacterized repeat protein (TIGR01451 family)
MVVSNAMALKSGENQSLLVASKLNLTGVPIGNIQEKGLFNSKKSIAKHFASLPISFEENRGQHRPEVKYFVRGTGYSTFLTSNSLTLAVRQLQQPQRHDLKKDSYRPNGKQYSTNQPKMDEILLLSMELVDADENCIIKGELSLNGSINYLRGNDPAKWIQGITHYGAVRYKSVYPGIDLLVFGAGHQLEYDFVVSPGADPTVITFNFKEVDNIEINETGQLVLHTKSGDIRQKKPLIYQEEDGKRIQINGGYEFREDKQIGFKVASYDTSKPLIIDPIIHFLTSFSGNSQDDALLDMAVDDEGFIYLAGTTSADNLPVTSGAFQTSYQGGDYDAFVAKLNPAGTEFVYFTYLGGSGSEANTVSPEAAGAIALDDSGSVTIIGQTQSADFPITPGAFQSVLGGRPGFPAGVDVFVSKLNADGSDLEFSTFLGGYDLEIAGDVAIDSQGNVYITGASESTPNVVPFPTTTTAYQQTIVSGWDAFVTKLNNSGTALEYSTLLGGSSFSDFGTSIQVDDNGMIYVAGNTESTNFPTRDPIQATNAGGSDVFLAMIDPIASGNDSLIFSTYYGGSSFESDLSLDVDGLGNMYLAGNTWSNDFPGTHLSQPSCAANVAWDVFVTKITNTGDVSYSTCMGGTDELSGVYAIAVDDDGCAHISGWTQSTEFPPRDPVDQVPTDFIGRLNDTGLAFDYLTHISGARAMSLDSQGNVFLAGSRSYPSVVPITVTRISPEESYRFVVLADSRGSNSINCENNIDACVNKPALRNVFSSIQRLQPPPNFIFFSGDMVMGFKNSDRVKAELDVWKATIENDDSANGYTGMGTDYTKKFLYPVFGGHERNSLSCSHNKTIPCTQDSECSGDATCDLSALNAFTDFFDPVLDSAAGLTCQYLNEATYGHTVYYCDFGNDRFFVLNNDCIPAAQASDEPDDDGCGRHELGSEQLDWLEDNLQTDGHNFFFHHEPAYGTASHNAISYNDTTPIKDYDNNIIAPKATMDNKQKQRNDYIRRISDVATLLFAGHEHQYTRRTINNEFVNLEPNKNKSIVIFATPLPPNRGPRTAESYNGESGKAPLLHIEYTPPSSSSNETIEVRVKNGRDDAEEALDGTVNLISSDLELIDASLLEQQSLIGMRWTGVSIPQGSTITNAYIQFTVDETGSELLDVRFYGEAADYAEPFNTTPQNLSTRPKTTAYVDWMDVGAWNSTGATHNTANLKSIIQEIVDQPSWHDNLILMRTFYEVKAGSAGAPWYDRSKQIYSQSLAAHTIDLDPPWSTQNPPYHYAVVDVNPDNVSVEVYAFDDTPFPLTTSLVPAARQSVLKDAFVTNAKLIDLPLRSTVRHFDRDQDGAIDAEEGIQDDDYDNIPNYSDQNTARLVAPTGAGSLIVNVPDDKRLRNADTLTDMDMRIDQKGKPQRRFPYGLLKFMIIDVDPGDMVTVEINYDDAVLSGYGYYIANGWQSIPMVFTEGVSSISIDLTDGGAEDDDGEANGVIVHTGGLAEPELFTGTVNALVEFKPIASTITFIDDTIGCGFGEYSTSANSIQYTGRVKFVASLQNTASTPLYDLVSIIRTLTNNNIVANTDISPGAAGAFITIGNQDDYADGVLDPGEFVNVPFDVCVEKNVPFSLFVDVVGRLSSAQIEDSDVIPLMVGETDLVLTKSDVEDPVQYRDELTYILEVKNNGPSDSTGLVLTDNLPNKASFISVDATAGTCAYEAGMVTCLIDRLASDEEVKATIVVTPRKYGTYVNRAKVTALHENDTNISNNVAKEKTKVVPSKKWKNR